MSKLKKHPPLWLLVLAIGILLIAVGTAQGGFADTLRKASLICYECIGVG
ncbi:MAG: hypothetical protein FWG23_06495 [Eggerthellaceae bacterium]|nr:hypothetical protein [Eggerthellaceae bacterium]